MPKLWLFRMRRGGIGRGWHGRASWHKLTLPKPWMEAQVGWARAAHGWHELIVPNPLLGLLPCSLAASNDNPTLLLLFFICTSDLITDEPLF